MTAKRPVESRYKKLEQVEHVLLRPDTYVGAVTKNPAELWVFDEESQQIKKKTINYTPAMFKIFGKPFSSHFQTRSLSTQPTTSRTTTL